jgi:hypothetical protein
MRVDFEDGGWAEIMTAAEMPRRVTVRMREMIADIPEDQHGHAVLRDMEKLRDTLMAMVVKQWSYNDSQAPTGDAAEMYDLPQASYDKLREETRPHWEKAGFFERDETETEEAPKAAPEKTNAGKTSSA